MQTSVYQTVFTSEIQIIPCRHPHTRQSSLQIFRLFHADIPVPDCLHFRDSDYPMQTSPYQAVFTSDIQIIPRRHPYARQSLLQRFRLSHADIPVPGSLHLKDLEYPMHPRTRQPLPGRFRLKDLHRPNQPSARQPGIVT